MSDYTPLEDRRRAGEAGQRTGRRATDRLAPWYKRKTAVIVVLFALMTSTVLSAALLIFVNMAYDEAKCDAYSAETGRETRYTRLVGCMIRIPGGWIPKEELRQVQRLNP